MTEPPPADGDSLTFPRGNPLRLLRGGGVALAGALGAFLLMAENGQLRLGVPLGIACAAVAAFGVMDLVGSFDDPEAGVATRTTLASLAPALVTTAGALLLFALSLMGAASGVLRQPVWGVVVTVTFLALVGSVFRLGVALGPWATDELGHERPLWERHGFWVIVAASVLLLPCMGSSTLWDPWETHYGEVAREILARDDWISLWWAQDGWFWSKPILDFWIQAIFMATLGVHYQPDRMLNGWNGAEAHPEWIVRAPVFLLSVLAVYVLYKGVAKVFGRRAALFGAVILVTMPDFWTLAHQTMTDMPFVAPITCAMGLMLYGLFTPEGDRVRLYEVTAGRATFRFSAWHLVFGAVLVAAIPEIVYLFSRNLELVVHGAGPYGFRAHWDEFKGGSGLGNCGLPGNEVCTTASASLTPAELRSHVDGVVPAVERFVLAFEPSLQALAWTLITSFLLYLNWGERRARRVVYLGAWFFAAVATMAKGPAGFALPILCGLAFVGTTKRWRELVRFELVSGLMILLVVALPWGVAMYVRHGAAFTERLIVHDMVERTFSHVHDTNEGDDTSFRFYVWQLGYALFPWTGLAPLGLVYSLRRADAAGPEGEDGGRGQASILLLMWFLFAFALFSFMGTKFHHYILPAIPPVAMLLGVALHDMLAKGSLLVPGAAREGTPVDRLAAVLTGLPAYLALLMAASAVAVLGVSRAWPGSITGEKGDGGLLAPASPWLSMGLSALGVALFVTSVVRFHARSTEPSADTARDAHAELMFSAAAVAGALLLLIVGRDLVIKPTYSDQPGAIRLIHLFTYNYRRPWPDSLDYSAILTGFTVVAAALLVALSVRRIREPMVMAFMAFAMVWALWGLDVFMAKTAPHWGQHEILEAYYANRASPSEPFVAYQMNWKGENFYTGNRVPAFVSSGGPFTTWVRQQRDKGVHAIFVVTEHGRVTSLKSEIGGKSYRELTDKTQNNKFVLVRAEI